MSLKDKDFPGPSGPIVRDCIFIYSIFWIFGCHGISMSDLYCDGFPSLDLIGNPTTQVFPRLY